MDNVYLHRIYGRWVTIKCAWGESNKSKGSGCRVVVVLPFWARGCIVAHAWSRPPAHRQPGLLNLRKLLLVDFNCNCLAVLQSILGPWPGNPWATPCPQVPLTHYSRSFVSRLVGGWGFWGMRGVYQLTSPPPNEDYHGHHCCHIFFATTSFKTDCQPLLGGGSTSFNVNSLVAPPCPLFSPLLLLLKGPPSMFL